ncbi:MAG: histidine kinase dimerization/phospho-acceptor domain-containing protein, partial [Longimicrobiales bacterium]
MSVKDNAASRIKMRWPLLLLLVSIAATAVVAFEAQRQVRSHRRTSLGLLRDYTSIASWNYQRYASEALRDGIVSVLGPVMHFQLHGQLHEGKPELITWFTDHYHDRRSPHYGDPYVTIPEHLPATYFGFSIGADTLAVAGQPMRRNAARALTDTLNAHIRRVYKTNWGAGLITVGETTVAYTIMPTTLGDTIVYGFVFEPATFAPLFRRVFERAELLPSTLMRERPNAEVLDVAVVAPGRRMLFESSRREYQPYHGMTEVAPQFGGLVIVTTLKRGVADQLIIGGLPRSRLPFLLALLGIAAGLALVAVGQLRREGQLARQRSDFVSSVSHELRTPLAQIRLFLETLRLRRYESAAQSEWML